MIYGLPAYSELWEVAAAIQVCQAHGVTDVAMTDGPVAKEKRELLQLAGITLHCEGQADVRLETDRTLRQLETGTAIYPELLAKLSGLPPSKMAPPVFPDIEIVEQNRIIVSPFQSDRAFQLPWTVWQAIIKHLRTYKLPVHLVGAYGQRADYGGFTEGSILSELPLEQKLKALAGAKVVLGVPGVWTWAAACWARKVIVLHPDNLPLERWFGFDVAPRTLGRLLYTPDKLQIPVILAGLRKLIEVM